MKGIKKRTHKQTLDNLFLFSSFPFVCYCLYLCKPTVLFLSFFVLIAYVRDRLNKSAYVRVHFREFKTYSFCQTLVVVVVVVVVAVEIAAAAVVVVVVVVDSGGSSSSSSSSSSSGSSSR